MFPGFEWNMGIGDAVVKRSIPYLFRTSFSRILIAYIQSIFVRSGKVHFIRIVKKSSSR